MPSLATLQLRKNCFVVPWPSAVNVTCAGLGRVNCDPTPRPAIDCAQPRPPSPPTGVVASPRNGAVGVSWLSPAPAEVVDKFTIMAACESLPALNVTVEVPGTQTTAVVGTLTNGVSYEIYVYASNAAGESAPGIAGPVTPRTVPDVATGVTCASVVKQVVNASWVEHGDGGSPIVNTTVQGTDGGKTVSTVVTTENVTLTAFDSGATVRVRVAPVNVAGAAPWSQWSSPCTVCCSPTPTPTPAPTPLPYPAVQCNATSVVSVSEVRNPSQNYLNVTLCGAGDCSLSRACSRFVPPNSTVDLIADASALYLVASYCESGSGGCLPARLDFSSARVNSSSAWSPPLVAISSDKQACAVDADCGAGGVWCRPQDSPFAPPAYLFCTSEWQPPPPSRCRCCVVRVTRGCGARRMS